MAAGDFEAAQRDFQDAAKLAADPKAKAEAHYNAYRAALERQAWGEALTALREAVAADPAGSAPSRSTSTSRSASWAPAASASCSSVRTATWTNPSSSSRCLSELDRDIAEVFAEARALEDLNHPAIIRLRDCDYADAGRSRPFW